MHTNLEYVLCFSISRLPRLLVATADAYLYIYNIDPEEGGDCTLLKQHRYVLYVSFSFFQYLILFLYWSKPLSSKFSIKGIRQYIFLLFHFKEPILRNFIIS